MSNSDLSTLRGEIFGIIEFVENEFDPDDSERAEAVIRGVLNALSQLDGEIKKISNCSDGENFDPKLTNYFSEFLCVKKFLH